MKKRPTNRPTSTTVQPKGAIKDLAETKKHDTLLLGDIQAFMLQQHHQESDRRKDIIHPSETAKADWCIRSTYYRMAGYQPTDARDFSVQLETIFAEGHVIHAKWQDWLKGMGRLWGKWQCPSCSFIETKTYQPKTDYCSYCGGKYDLIYREVDLEDTDLMIAGHADGAIEDIQALLEVKSIGLGTLRMEEPELVKQFTVKSENGKTITDLQGLWNSIHRPLPSHLRQTQVYLELCSRLGLPFDKVVFIYEFKANQAVKEFVVKYNPRHSKNVLEKSAVIRESLESNIPPKRSPIFTIDKQPCKECLFRTKCYTEEPVAQGNKTDTTDLDTGSRISRRRRTTADSGADASQQTLRRAAPNSRRSDRPRRQPVDESVRSVDVVDGVPGGATGGSGSRRRVGRGYARTSQRTSKPTGQQ